jgi:hypothetical protein
MAKRTNKPGRDPGPPENVKSARIPVLLTPTDYDALAALAEARGVSMAQILREDARAAGHLPSEGSHNGPAH